MQKKRFDFVVISWLFLLVILLNLPPWNLYRVSGCCPVGFLLVTLGPLGPTFFLVGIAQFVITVSAIAKSISSAFYYF